MKGKGIMKIEIPDKLCERVEEVLDRLATLGYSDRLPTEYLIRMLSRIRKRWFGALVAMASVKIKLSLSSSVPSCCRS